MTARLESSKPRTKPDHVLFQFPFAQPSFPFCSRIRGSEARERDDQETPKLLLNLSVEVGLSTGFHKYTNVFVLA